MTPIEQFRAAGFSDQEIGEWAETQRSTWRTAGFSDAEVDDYLGGPKPKASQAFLDRLSIGSAILDGRAPVDNGAHPDAAMGDYGPGNFLVGLWKGLTTPSAEMKQRLAQAGPGETAGALVGRVPIGQIIDQIRQGGDLLQRAMETGELPALRGNPLAPGGAPGGAEEMVGNALLGMTAPITRLPGGLLSSPTRKGLLGGFARLDRAPDGKLREVSIGGIPDRGDAAAAVSAVVGIPHPLAQGKVERLWEDHGIHPAEVAHDAARDPTIAQDLLSSGPELPRAYVRPEDQPKGTFRTTVEINGERTVIEGPTSTPQPSALPRPVPERPMAPISAPDYVQEALSRDWGTANRLGVVDDIERMAADGKDAGQVAQELGPRLNDVRALARANGEPERNAATQFVRNIRTGLGIPSLDQHTEYAAWLDSYKNRAASEPAPAAAERPQASEAAPEGAAASPTPEAAPGPAEGAVEGFTTSKGSTYEVHEDGTTTRNKSFHPEHGAADVGLKARSTKTIYVDSAAEAMSLSGAGVSGVGTKGHRLVIQDGKATLVWENHQTGRWGTAASNRDIAFTTEPEAGKFPVEMWKPADDVPGYSEAYSGQHAGNEIVEVKKSAPPETAKGETVPPAPAPEGGTAPPLEGGTAAEPSPQLRAFAPGDLRVDATRFQFKEGGDASGVTDRLHGVQQWDPLKAGMTLVYEDKDGQHWIADGHQRLGLAKRIEQADPGQAPRLNSWVLREADGVTDADVRAVAAAKNIAEGTWTAVDAAKVLRDRPDLMDTLPPRSELVRQARGLMNLDPDAFGKVVNDVVPPNYASIVGRLVESDPKLQNALIDLLAKTQPENVVQAESIVRSGIDAGLHTETQATLFGDQELVSSLYADRARILDRTLKQLRRDRTVFQAIVDNSAIIEDLGNRLAQDANARRAATDGHAVQILQTLANRRGALSDALTGLARSVASGDLNHAAAARDFVAEIRRQTESGALTRAADGGSGSHVAAAREGGASGGDRAQPAAASERSPRDVSPAEEARAAEQARIAIKHEPRAINFEQWAAERGIESGAYAEPGMHNASAHVSGSANRAALKRLAEKSEDLSQRQADARAEYDRLVEAGALRPLTRQERIEQAAASHPDNPATQAAQRLLEKRGIVEKTDQGDQLVMPGAERSARQAAQSREESGRGMATTDVRQQEPGGLFEAPKPEEPDLFFQPKPGTDPVGMGLGAPPPTRTAAESAILDHISVGEQTDKRPWSWSRLYTNVWDRLHPISEMVADAGEVLPTSQHPYRLARLMAGNAGRAQHWIEFGQLDFTTGEKIGPALKEIIAPFQHDLDGLRAFSASVRALELENRGIETGMNLSAARQVAATGLDQYAPTLARLIQYQDNLAKYLRDAGVLSPEGYIAMREANRLYVPFYRVIGDEPGAARGAGGSLQASNPIHRIKGSEREIIDPIESIVRNTQLYVTMAQRNRVGNSIVDLLSGTGGAHRRGTQTVARGPAEHFEEPTVPLAHEVPGTPEAGVAQAIRDLLHETGLADELFDFVAAAVPPREGEIRIFRQGKAETWSVGRDVADAVKALDAEATNTIVRMLAMPARMLRAGATLTPDFMLRNPVRDFFGAFVQSSTGVFTPIRSARGLYSAVIKDEHFQGWLKDGGGNSELVAMDRQYLQENLRKLTQDTGLMSRAWNVVRHPLDALRMVSELSEQMTRIGEYRAVKARELRAGASPMEAGEAAAFASREVTIDFARMGAKMRAANMLVAFMNAQIQGTDRLVRAIKDNPVGTGIKIAAGITLPSVLLWWANHDDPRYQEIPQWERDLFWIVMTENHIFRVPKPFELGVLFGSGAERMLDAFVAERPEAFDGLTKSIAGALIPSVFPTATVPVVEQWANRSSFTDRNLIPAQAEKHLPEYEYQPYTTELAKALGQIVAAFPGARDTAMSEGPAAGVARALTTPILIENYIRGWTGGLGMYALNAADAALRKQGLLPDPPKPEDTLADIPVVKAFVVRHPSASAESIQKFYDGYERNKRYFDTWMAKAQEGDETAMARIQAAGGDRIFVQLDGIKQVLAEHSKLVREIWKDQETSPQEKRQLIDQLYFSEIQIAKEANDMMRQVDQAMPR